MYTEEDVKIAYEEMIEEEKDNEYRKTKSKEKYELDMKDWNSRSFLYKITNLKPEQRYYVAKSKSCRYNRIVEETKINTKGE